PIELDSSRRRDADGSHHLDSALGPVARRRPRRSRTGWRFGNHWPTAIFPRSPWGIPAATRPFAPARVLRRRNGGADGGPAIRFDERAPKTGGLQSTDTHEIAFPVDFGPVHREAAVQRWRPILFVQHSPTA